MALQSTYNPQGGTGISLQGGNYPLQGGNINLNNTPVSGIKINTSAPAPAAQPAAAPVFSSGSSVAPVYAPNLNLSNIYNQASQTAQGAVNPYYTKQLQDFQAQQAQDKANQQQQTAVNIQQLQDQLNNTLNANTLTGQRTSADTLANEQQAGIQADQQQQTQGTQFDQARIAQAKQLASQGLTTSGIGGQQVLGSETDRNTQEGQQAQAQKAAFDQSELLKSRTFEDLANSGALATKAEATGETQANFDLNKYIEGQASSLQQEQQQLEQARLQAVASQTSQQAKLLVNNFIQSLSNPAQRLAAAQQYGSAF